jgi:hypothetical protein
MADARRHHRHRRCGGLARHARALRSDARRAADLGDVEAFSRLTAIQAQPYVTTIALGPVQDVVVLRRRMLDGQPGSLVVDPRPRFGYVVGLDDGGVAWSAPALADFGREQLAELAVATTKLLQVIQDEQLRRLQGERRREIDWHAYGRKEGDHGR